MPIAESRPLAGSGPISPPRTAPADEPSESLWPFWAPRYWPTWLLLGWLRLAAALPWATAIRLHKALGRGLWRLLPRRRRIVERNLELCFPKLGRSEVEALTKRNFENIGACIAELAHAWFGRGDRPGPVFRVEGREHLDAALGKGHGVILLSGHFTTLEISVPIVKTCVPFFAFMFSPRGNPLLNAVQINGRRRAAHASFANNNVRGMIRLLRQNAVVWYAPDQASSGNSGELLHFFGEPAMTNTAASRLARASGAAVVPLFFRRLPDDSGYLVRFEPALDGVPSADSIGDTERLMHIIERFVRECPEQYFWIHRKFRGRPKEIAAAYDHGSAERRPAALQAAKPGRALWAIVGAALFIVAADNLAFWDTVTRATALDEHRFAIFASLFAILFFTLTIVLSLAVNTRLLKLLTAGLLMLAAGTGFFMTEYGIVVDPSMIRNVMATQVREAAPLLTHDFYVHVALFGVLPAAGFVLLPLGGVPLRRALAARGVAIAVSATLLVGTLYVNYGAVSFFGHQHHSARLLMNPGYPLYSYIHYLLRADDEPPAERASLGARLTASALTAERPTLFVLVLGETARADRFSLNGYERDTNEYTRGHGAINFGHVNSCGTSTADSLPCLFSHLGRTTFTHAKAAAYDNLFTLLGGLGVDVFWRDNSTGCKDICDPDHFAEFAARTDPTLCDSTGCIDEILLDDIDGMATNRQRDHFIVLHQRGSHGPAYYTDTPRWSKRFLPECDLPNLRNCDLALINNAYDNTIVYTDYILSRVIEFLESQSEDFETAMLYVSDHGESLGENGLYLHGFPYAIAPAEQTHVPMLFWASPEFLADRRIDAQCVESAADRELSHDTIFHSLLALFRVETPYYERQLDMFAPCRAEDRPLHSVVHAPAYRPVATR